MFSRAHLLVERDWERLLKEKLWGIEVCPIKDDNIFEWSAKILGPRDSLWEGGVFRLYLKFDENYGQKPPEVCFHTIPFHPNVDMITGRPCIDFLDDWKQWLEGYNLTTLLLTVQLMLANPVLENAVNQDAVNMLLKAPHSYKQMVLDCVAASQRVEVGLSPHTDQDMVHFAPTDEEDVYEISPRTSVNRRVPVSFEEYHNTWSGIATSKPNPNAENPLLAAIKDNIILQEAHFGMPADEMHEYMQKQLQEQNELIYGRFRAKPNDESAKKSKLDRINQMKKIYLAPRTPRKTPVVTDAELQALSRHKGGDEEHWEEQVDDLVAWTRNLDEGML